MPSTKIKSLDLKTFNEKVEKKDFDLTDKVEYDDFIRENIPDEIIFPEELNRFLRDHIRELTSENGCLRRSLEELEKKLSAYSRSQVFCACKNPQEIKEVGLLKSSEIAASKIVELSKRCRDQTAELEVLKSRCKKLTESKLRSEQIKTEEIKSSLDSGDGNRTDFRPLTIEDELKNREEETKLLRDKIHRINSRLYESKNACTSLRQDLNKAQKLLCREIGENVTIASLSSNTEIGWKGRAEQIKHLQNKLIEYEGVGSSRGSSASLLEKRNLTNLRTMEKERRKRAEDSARELRKLNVDIETYKRKHEASKARVKVLESDLTSVKQSVLLLNEKRSHDDQLIHALNGQLKAAEEKFNAREKELTISKDRAENERVIICAELNRLRSSNDNLRRVVDERETEIDKLRNGSTRENKNKNKPHSSSSVEKDMEFYSNNTQDYNEYVTLVIAAEAERERLLELIIVLNRRLEEERFASDKISETLRAERGRLAKLETKLQRIEMERFGLSKVNTGYNKPRSSKSTILRSPGTEGDVLKDETRFRLELLEEECLALKTRLATVQRDKTSDLNIYKQMLDQARKTFQDAYRGKSNYSSYSTVTI